MRISKTISHGLIAALWATGGAIFPKDGVAQPLDIDVHSSTYTTFIRTMWHDALRRDTSTTRVSINPISDSVRDRIPDYGRNGMVEAAAEAGTFEVMASGSAWLWSALASARSDIVFSPLGDGFTDLTINFGRFFEYGFTGGHISLTDLTSSEELFNYEWAQLMGPGNIPWNKNTAAVDLNEYFDNDHTYSLSMSVDISANRNSALATIDISGFQVAAVPEPSTYALMVAALGAVGLAARRKKVQLDQKHLALPSSC